MSLTTFEQSSLSRSLFGRQADFLAEGMEVQLELHDGEAVTGGPRSTFDGSHTLLQDTCAASSACGAVTHAVLQALMACLEG